MKTLLIKIFGTSYTAITNAWNFNDEKTISATLISISTTLAGAALKFSEISKHFLGISGVLFVMVVSIITTDFITGLAYAYMEERRLRRHIVCAAKGIRSAYKLGTYIVFLFCLTALVNEYEGMWVAACLKYIHIYITIHIFFWESFSVDENLQKLGVNMGLRKFMTKILSSFQSKVETAIEEKTQVLEDDKKN